MGKGKMGQGKRKYMKSVMREEGEGWAGDTWLLGSSGGGCWCVHAIGAGMGCQLNDVIHKSPTKLIAHTQPKNVSKQ